jgi:Ca-activated chloride channel family protein
MNADITSATFHDPLWLLLLLSLPVIAWLRRRRTVPALVVPGAHEWHSLGAAPSALWPILCVYAGLALLIVALARPQVLVPLQDHKRRGYDFIIAIDLSTSMYAEDFQRGATPTNRLQAVKPIISAFINERPDDRIGIVVFGGRAYTFAPLTFDHDWLRRQTARLAIGLIEDGTAIGDAIGVALRRLREGRKDEQEGRQGSFIVLLTDGSSNKGSLDPRQAARLAAEDAVAIYTIGAGAEGLVPVPTFDYAGKRTGTEMRESEVDSLLLRDVAEAAGGLFFRATDANAILDAFARIDEMQKIEFTASPPLVSRELFYLFALIGTGLLGLASYEAHFRAARLQGAA